MRRLAFCLLLSSAAAPAFAQTTERYALQKTEDGYVRLDTQSGTVSVCREEGSQLVCRMAADDRVALEDETERLRADLERLERRVATLEGARSMPLPSDEDIGKTLDMAEKLLRGFMGIAKDLEREAEGDAKPAPNRT